MAQHRAGHDGDDTAGRARSVPDRPGVGIQFQWWPQMHGYRTKERLGQGGSAEVWRVIREADGAAFALRCPLRGTSREDAPGVDAGLPEHPHLLGDYGPVSVTWCHSGDQAHVQGGARESASDPAEPLRSGQARLMALAEGGSLADVLSVRRVLTPGQLVSVMVPICQALEELHRAGRSHGDIAPGNVLFAADATPLLADYGELRVRGLARTSELRGTPGLLAPEAEPGVTADVYSVAALAWYCLAGTPPGPAADRAPLPLLVPGVPLGIVQALEAGLSERAEQRPRAAELARALYRGAIPEDVPIGLSAPAQFRQDLVTVALGSGRLRGKPGRVGRLGAQVRAGKAGNSGGAGKAGAAGKARRSENSGKAGNQGRDGKAGNSGGAGRPGKAARALVLVRAGILAAALLTGLCGALFWLGAGSQGPAVSKPGLVDPPTRTAPATPLPSASGPSSASPSSALRSTAAPASPGKAAPGIRDGWTEPLRLPQEDTKSAAEARRILTDLLRTRSAILTGGQEGPERVFAPGSAAMVQEQELLRGVRARQVSFEGFQMSVGETRILTQNRSGIELESLLASKEFVIRDSAPRAMAASTDRVRIRLVQVGSAWRIAEVKPIT